MRIREYARTDRPHLAACLDSLQDHMVRIDPRHRTVRPPGYGDRVVPFILRHLRNDQGFVRVAEVGGRPVGLSVGWIRRLQAPEKWEEVPSKTGYLSDLVVLPEWRRKGVGTRLLRDAEQRFRRLNCDQMTLGVFAPNRVAFRLYGHEGFVPRSVYLAKSLGRPGARTMGRRSDRRARSLPARRAKRR